MTNHLQADAGAASALDEGLLRRQVSLKRELKATRALAVTSATNLMFAPERAEMLVLVALVRQYR